MTKRRKVVAACCAAAVVAGGAAAASSSGSSHPTATTTTTVVVAPTPPPPDMLNPDVSPQTQGKTICTKGWTATVRPPQGYTSSLKGRQIVSYHYADTNPSHFEEDHVVSLELGGAPSAPANLFPEPHSVSGGDDQTEGQLRAQVCAHKMTLADAQAQIYAVKLSHGYQRAASVK